MEVQLTLIRNTALKWWITFGLKVCYKCFKVRCVLCKFVLTKIKLKIEIFCNVNLVVQWVVPMFQRHSAPSNCWELLIQ